MILDNLLLYYSHINTSSARNFIYARKNRYYKNEHREILYMQRIIMGAYYRNKYTIPKTEQIHTLCVYTYLTFPHPFKKERRMKKKRGVKEKNEVTNTIEKKSSKI